MYGLKQLKENASVCRMTKLAKTCAVATRSADLQPVVESEPVITHLIFFRRQPLHMLQ